MDVYVDVLLLENLLMDYLILNVTAKFAKKPIKTLRLLLGALIGAIYAVVIMFLPDMQIYYTAPAKFLLSAAIVMVTYFPSKVRDFLKTLVCFYIATFIFAGGAFALLSFGQGQGVVKNGAYYMLWDSPFNFAIIAGPSVFLLVRAFYKWIREIGAGDKILVSLYVVFDGNGVWVPALVDTGNQLKDPISGDPVIIVEADAVKGLMPTGLIECIGDDDCKNMAGIECVLREAGWFSKFRLVPFSSLGRSNGLLPGFKPDYIEVGTKEGKKETKQVVVCLYKHRLSRNSDYSALLAPELV
ncbi:MAG: sigma-E processing peptidase SpoIIGA [Clostridiales bacterium]|jgi:stage II sporulation protein GA (sporulation sigma-E factor processing peptidase)|nr:sigma-E processing peptidase SpoIIGA [Clostridiales bacterium]